MEKSRKIHKTKPNILIAGYFGYGNVGDEAILTAILDDLDAAVPQAECIVISGDPDGTTLSHGRETVGWNDVSSIVESVRKSDLVIVGGGGLFHDYWPIDSHELLSASKNRLASYLSIPLLCTMLKTPSMAYSVGIGPLRSTSARDQVRFAFENFDSISVRDEESAAILKSLGVDSTGSMKAVVTADPAFRIDAASIADARAVLAGGVVDLQRPVCGVNLRYWDFGIDPAQWEGEVAQALDQWVEQFDGQVVFIPMQHGSSTPYVDDRRVCERVQAAMKSESRSRVLHWQKGPRRTAAIFAACTVNLTMRMHGALFSILGGVPTVGLSYDDKVMNLFKRADLLEFAIPIENLRAAEIFKKLDQVTASNDSDAMSLFIEKMRELAGRNTRMAVELLEEGGYPNKDSDYGFAELALDKSVRLVALEEDLKEAELRQQQRSAEIAELQSQLENKTDRIARLQTEHDVIESQRDSSLAILRELQSTTGMKLLAKYWLLMGWIIPPGSRRKLLYRRLRAALSKTLHRSPGWEGRARIGWGGNPQSKSEEAGSARVAVLDRLNRFAASNAGRGVGSAVLVLSPTALSASEGQRATHLAFELANRGDAVIFAYWRWDERDWSGQEYHDDRIIQLPLDILLEDHGEILRLFATFTEKTILMEFPYPGFFRLLASANADGWVTIYDVADNWEAFNRVGQAPWYEKEFEVHVASTVDLVCAVSPSLQARLQRLGRADTRLIPNGWPQGIEHIRRELPMERGDITLGYFGYLSDAWFDWHLIREVAIRKPSWRFHLIGYGGVWPISDSMPGNISLLGKRPQDELAALAANWDVGIVPFKDGAVATDADPIKTYEYLAMRLPVVATGVSAPVGGEKFVKIAIGAEDFMEKVELAIENSAEFKLAQQAYTERSTWSVRVDSLLDLISEQPAIELKHALFAEMT